MARLASFDARSSLSTDYLRPSGLDDYNADDPFGLGLERQNYTPPSPADLLAADVFGCLSRGTTTDELLRKLTAASDETLHGFLVKVQSLANVNSGDPAAKGAFDWLIATTNAVIESRKPPSAGALLTKQVLDKLQGGTTLDELVSLLLPAGDDALHEFKANIERLASGMSAASDDDRQAKDLLGWLNATATAVVDSRKPG